MTDGEAHGAGRLVCANPDCACSADERERVVTNQYRGTFQSERDWIVRVVSYCAEFIGNAHDHTGCIRTVRYQFMIVGDNDQLGVNPFPRNCFRYGELAIDIALHTKIAPSETNVFQ